MPPSHYVRKINV